VIADRNVEGATVLADDDRKIRPGSRLAVSMDVTDEQAVVAGFAETTLACGGIVHRCLERRHRGFGPGRTTTLEDWGRQHAVLVTATSSLAGVPDHAAPGRGRGVFGIEEQPGRGQKRLPTVARPPRSWPGVWLKGRPRRISQRRQS
jgi:NAD(P)-dependent dehydrogenase (short-subunit alcohol dehydrogenase family)